MQLTNVSALIAVKFFTHLPQLSHSLVKCAENIYQML